MGIMRATLMLCSRLLVALAIGWLGNIQTARAQSIWHWANPTPQGNDLHDVLWSNHQFVAVGSGTLLTSPDGVDWTPRSTGYYAALYGVMASDKTLVVVGAQGLILTSPDGITWTARFSATTNNLYRGIWNGKEFVVVGEYGTILTSPDGFGWTTFSAGVPADELGDTFTSVAWNGALFVVVTNFGTILTSPDGLAWSEISTFSGTTILNGVAWNGALFVAIGGAGAFVEGPPSTILTSPDGINWTTQDSGTADFFVSVIWNGEQFVAIGDDGSGDGVIATSPDGVHWTSQVSGTTNTLTGIAFNGAAFVAVGSGGAILRSDDAQTWHAQTQGMPDLNTNYFLNGVAWGNGQFVAGAFSGLVFTSPDGVVWTQHDTGLSNFLNGIAFIGSQFVAVGFDVDSSTSVIATSPDGTTWTRRSSPTSHDLNAVAGDGDRSVVVADSGTILTSSDGITWVAQSLGTGNALSGVATNGHAFVVVGQNGTILTSPDGSTWQAANSGTSDYLLAVTADSQQFVAVGINGTILTSPDGLAWTSRASGIADDLQRVAAVGNEFIAVGLNGAIVTSIDGINWTSHFSGTYLWLQGVASNGSRFVAVGAGAAILYSDRDTVAPFVNQNQHGLTGSWFNPATSGQGLEIEVFPDLNGAGRGLLFAGWFTYDAINGSPRWYALSGNVSATSATTTLQIYADVGGNFNAPPSVGTSDVLGQATIAFSDCTSGSLSYEFTDGSNRSGTIPLTRLTPNVTCSPSGDSGTAPGDYLLSGNWYNPETSGQGLIFDISPSISNLFAAWYTFLPNGQTTGGPASQNWFTLQADQFTNGSTSLANIPIIETSGGIFDNPARITEAQVGTANIVFQNCNAMSMTYQFTGGQNKGLQGTIPLKRIVPTQAACGLDQ